MAFCENMITFADILQLLNMTKKATTLDEQIDLLEQRGLTISDRGKAKEILLDIGYYRLGFYLFPFEKTYPSLCQRTHEYAEGASIEDAVRLYYFDFDLRLLLMRYLNRIEIAFRTAMIYHLSNKYSHTNIWYVDANVVNRHYARLFEEKVYTQELKRNFIISRHHRMNPNDRFAPAWKTLEFMTLGAVMKLYEELRNQPDKVLISQKFGVRQVVTFENYMHTVRSVRNACAHGLLLYDFRLDRAIRRGPAGVAPEERSNVIGALRVVRFIMNQISIHRAEDMSQQIRSLYEDVCEKSPRLRKLIPDFSKI